MTDMQAKKLAHAYRHAMVGEDVYIEQITSGSEQEKHQFYITCSLKHNRAHRLAVALTARPDTDARPDQVTLRLVDEWEIVGYKGMSLAHECPL